ncbi:mucin-2 [Streptomyces sp. NPDC101206]|uniref:mucin-2 n=1 Tax=Streptomyces sp. NPDC101206 TaxID=3366128 RepID=UPI00381D5343
MPWFKIDDASHSHPKFMAAGNAALGLWLRCGAYSAQHLTEGHIPAAVAKAYGTPPQARKLVAVGLWHEPGHDCPRCPQPDAGYIVHDFFEGGRNSTRAQVEASRKGAAERAAKHRDSKKGERSARESDANRARIDDGSDPDRERNAPPFLDSTAGQGGSSHRTGLEGGATSHATATPSHSTSFGSGVAAASEPRAYDTIGDLKRAIADAGIRGVSWNLQASQIERVRQVRDRVGIPLMVSMAVSNASYRGVPGRASAWIEDWEGLEPDTTTDPGITRLPVARQQSPSPAAARRNAARDVLDRLTDQLRAAGGSQ